MKILSCLFIFLIVIVTIFAESEKCDKLKTRLCRKNGFDKCEMASNNTVYCVCSVAHPGDEYNVKQAENWKIPVNDIANSPTECNALAMSNLITSVNQKINWSYVILVLIVILLLFVLYYVRELSFHFLRAYKQWNSWVPFFNPSTKK